MADFAESSEPLTRLPFAPVTKTHILNCSFHSWHSRYRAFTPKARTIPLSQAFVDYLKADGIYLPPEENERQQANTWSDTDSGIFSSAENDDAAAGASDDDDEDPSAQWPEIHEQVRATIQELGGRVVPKLNWSAPKDATWIATGNSMDCRTPNEVYLLLKSSNFVTHDLENVFDDTVDDGDEIASEVSSDSTKEAQEGAVTAPLGSFARPTTQKLTLSDIPYHLVLRKYVQLNPSLEFRCFVRGRMLLCMCQRDLNHYDFLFGLAPQLRTKITDFFEEKLKNTFPDDSFVFDVYVPPPHKKVWLVDINPWAPRTDPLLFSWLEILTMPQPNEPKPAPAMTFKIANATNPDRQSGSNSVEEKDHADDDDDSETDSESDDDDDEEDISSPELRLVKQDDPEAYAFTSPQYSAHKLPRDVVDAAAAAQSDGAGLREFATQWKEALDRRQREEQEADSSSDEA